MNHSLFITCPKGLEGLLLEEMKQLGAINCKETVTAVHCEGSLETIYTICLWSRFANRVYLKLLRAEVGSTKDCYDACVSFAFEKVIEKDSTIAVDFMGATDYMRNTMFGAQLVKDAIVDRLQKTRQERPRVEPKDPDCLFHVRLNNGELSLYYDLSGHSLHQRGYRKDAGDAPIKENVAAALLARAGWLKMLSSPLIDPFCGSGTLLIEAAMMATDKAPGLDRLDYGFLHWQGHNERTWRSLQQAALERHEKAIDEAKPLLFGYDNDSRVVQVAKRNVKAAGFQDLIHIETRDIRDFALPEECEGKKGLLLSNPPYGERLGLSASLMPTYGHIGRIIKEIEWPAAILTSDPELARATKLRSPKQYAFMNGKIPCKLYLF